MVMGPSRRAAEATGAAKPLSGEGRCAPSGGAKGAASRSARTTTGRRSRGAERLVEPVGTRAGGERASVLHWMPATTRGFAPPRRTDVAGSGARPVACRCRAFARPARQAFAFSRRVSGFIAPACAMPASQASIACFVSASVISFTRVAIPQWWPKGSVTLP